MKRIEGHIWHPNVPTFQNVKNGAWKSFERSQRKWPKFKMVSKHETFRENKNYKQKKNSYRLLIPNVFSIFQPVLASFAYVI